MIIQFKRGHKNTLPRGELGEPLFAIDTGELFIGMGLDQDPVKINGVNVYSQSTQPTSPQVNDIWVDISNPDNIIMYIYDQNYGWVQSSQSGIIGNLDSLLTYSKDNIVNAINELYGKLFGQVLNFKLEIIDNGYQIKVTWKNPVNAEFNGRELYVSSDVDITRLTRDELQNVVGQGKQILVTDGLGSGWGNNEEYIVQTNINTMYYFKIFTKYQIGDYVFYSDGISASIEQKDIIPPGDLKHLIQIPLNNTIILQWENPDDEDFQGIRIVRKTGYYPYHENEVGPNVATFEITDGSTMFIDEGLINNTFYYYHLFPYDDKGNFNRNEANRIHTYPSAFTVPDVLYLSQASENEGAQVRLTFTNPTESEGMEYEGREIYVSTKDLSGYTRTMCLNDNEVHRLDNTFGMGPGNQDTFVYDSSNYEIGDRLYFKVFQFFKIINQIYYSNGTQTSVVLSDLVPPDNQIYIDSEVFEYYVKMKYKDPDNQDWQGTYIVRKQNVNPPLTETDGDLVTVNTIRNQYQNNWFIDDTNITVGMPYTYRFFPFDRQGNVNRTSDFFTVVPQLDPKSVKNFVADTSEENIVRLSWINPTLTEFPEWQGTLIIRNESHIPESPTDGVIVFQSENPNETQFIDVNVEPGKTYYYRQITYDYNNIYTLESLRFVKQTPYGIPPSNLISHRFLVQHNYIQLQWEEFPDPDWYNTKVIRNEVRQPIQHNDGAMVENVVGVLGKYKNKWFVDYSVVPDVTYYYGIFPGDTHGNYNINLTKGPIQVEDRPNPTNVSATSINNGLGIHVSFTCPSEDVPTQGNLRYMYLYQSLINISDLDMATCQNNDDVQLVSYKAVRQGTESFIEESTGFEVGKRYYLKVFSVYEKNTILYASTGVTTQITQSDITPPNDVVNFKVTQGDKEVHMTWGDPLNEDWQGTYIVRKQNEPPVDEFDGTLIIDSKIRDFYKAGRVLVDPTVENDVLYYYRQFPYDKNGNVNRTQNTFNIKSVTPYVQGIAEIPNQVTKLNVPQNADIDIKLQDTFLQNAHVDVLKLDTSTQAENSVRTITQFDLSDSQLFEYDEDSVEFTGVMKLKRVHRVNSEFYNQIDEGNIYALHVKKDDYKQLLSIDIART